MIKDNIKQSKYSTGVGIAMILIAVLKLSGVDIEEILGLTMEDILLYTGAGISGILLLIGKDYNK